ncbi:MAG TPA: Rieske 2Fe-2S domain-containing protein [Stellaceae bacterium]|jgi:3-phenylpropionate/trans-cinnamate dioxygenase ferredoxin subunit|nr:Rieske 2Fe-2S domain-containing protein [Stellaceae bacterium]
MSRHVVAHTDDIPEGGARQVEVKGRRIGVFKVNGEFFALLDKCPHEGASLCRGRLVGLAESDMPGEYSLSREGEMLRCPWHGWEFDIRSGQSYCDPANTKVKQFAVTVEDGATLAKGPYVAETFPVSIEQNYVVVEV